MILIAAATVALATATPIHSSEHCANASTTMEWNVCADRHLEESEGHLNDVYARLQRKLPSADKLRLVQAQRAWLKFRDANCLFEQKLNAGDGNGGQRFRLMCLSAMDDDRSAQLEDFDSIAAQGLSADGV